VGLVALLSALVAVGQTAQPLALEDQDGVSHPLIEASRPTLLIYEDQDGQKQNHELKALIAAYNDPLPNRSKLQVWPVADLSKWNWWPAKGHALADVKKAAVKGNTTVLIDWTGVVQKTWGAPKHKNVLVLVGTGGKVLFSSEGECDNAQRDALERELQALGLVRPTRRAAPPR
jgi:hypothetical protein